MSVPRIEPKGDIDVMRIKYTPSKKWSQYVLLVSDVHFDSKHCNRKMLKEHFDKAKERNAPIMSFGDFFDCMGGKYDPRSGKNDVRLEYNVPNYFDAIVKDAAKELEPYSDNIQFMSTGNHEASVLNRQEVDILQNLCEKLDVGNKKPYNGFVKFMFDRKGEKGGGRSSQTLYYSHGAGGNSPVTRGTIKASRRQVNIQANMFVSGHTHSKYILPLPYTNVSDSGIIVKSEQTHVNLGTYKDDSFGGINRDMSKQRTSGWADSNEFPPPSMGGCWLKFTYDTGTQKIKHSFTFCE